MELITILIGLGIILIVLLGAIGGFIVYYNKIYKYRIRLFYQLSGEEQYHEGKTYRARKVFLSKGGVQRLWVPKLKEYVSYFGKKMGENKYYYAEGPDGYLYNIVLGDLDTARGVLDIEPIDRDLRDFYITNQRNINERYQKPKNWPMILQSVTIVFIVILMFAGGYIIFDQMKVAGEQVSQNLESTITVTELQKELISKIYKLVGEADGGGSGIIVPPAP